MKTRIIQTRFWEDDIVQSVSKDANHLWIFLLSNKDIGMSNYYKMPDTLICYYTKLTDKDLQKAKLELEKTQKIFFYENWIFIPNLERENSYKNSPKNLKPYESELSHVPEKVKTHFLSVQATFDSSIDSSIDGVSIPHVNQKPKIINNKLVKDGGVGEEKIYLDNSDFDLLLENKEKFCEMFNYLLEDYPKLTDKWLYKKIKQLKDWHAEAPKSKKKKDMKRFLSSVVDRDYKQLLEVTTAEVRLEKTEQNKQSLSFGAQEELLKMKRKAEREAELAKIDAKYQQPIAIENTEK